MTKNSTCPISVYLCCVKTFGEDLTVLDKDSIPPQEVPTNCMISLAGEKLFRNAYEKRMFNVQFATNFFKERT